MTLEECVEVLTPIALAMRVQMDVPTFKAYAMVLADVPAQLAASGLEALIRDGARFMPTAPEIRVAAEKSRRQQLAVNQWEPCASCEQSPGWRSITDGRGDKRVERCGCKARHQELLEDRGLLAAIATLPDEGAAQTESAYPTLDQLAADTRQRLIEVARQKVIR